MVTNLLEELFFYDTHGVHTVYLYLKISQKVRDKYLNIVILLYLYGVIFKMVTSIVGLFY